MPEHTHQGWLLRSELQKGDFISLSLSLIPTMALRMNSHRDLCAGLVSQNARPVECGISGSRRVHLDPGFDLYTVQDSGTPDFLKRYGI